MLIIKQIINLQEQAAEIIYLAVLNETKVSLTLYR